MKMGSRLKPRRGIVLLLVISLLVLFVLIAATYAMVAGQYRNAAVSMSRRDLLGDNPRRELDQSMYMLLRDTVQNNNTGAWGRSPLQGHSLLADLYGMGETVNGKVTGGVSSIAPNPQGQFLSFDFANQYPGATFSANPAYYNGAVLTMVTGAAKGYSTFIVGYTGTGTTGTVQVEALNSDGVLIPTPAAGDLFVINGRAFDGTGYGYQQSTMNVDASDANGNPYALLPNFAGYPLPVSLTYGSTSPSMINVYGQANESWDAPDVHNLFLANVPPNATTSASITPSFHRPRLINYWSNQSTNWNATPPTLQRQVIFRPLVADHPNFTGSNISSPFDPINGPWDVDNDGDGITDSIWIDPGLPVITSRDGRRVKRLFAIMCQDLDGRIDLNAHGNLAQIDTSYWNGTNSLTTTTGYYAGVTSAATPLPAPLPRGLGFGPSEINPVSLFSSLTEYSNVLTARYGTDGVPGTSDLAGGTQDFFGNLKIRGVPNDYANNLSSFRSPPDIWGRGTVGIDYLGAPVTNYMGKFGEVTDHPYQINLSGSTTSQDTPYSITETERLLRYYDLDASRGNSRLTKLAPNTFASSINRQLVTTRSSHIPVPNVQLPTEFRNNMFVNGTTTIPSDLYVAKLRAGGVTPANIPAQLNIMVAPEMLKGQLFDINRAFGNGVDDNGNFVVDEPGETGTAWTNQNLPAGVSLPAAFTGIAMEPLNNDPVITNPTMIDNRQIYARHLYCLAMLLKDGFPNNNTNTAPDPATARRIAQWAVNVVDFRDPDSIMTGFEFDLNPWNGWNVDGDLTTTGEAERDVVWGAERPELLVTETLVFHDRRTEDLNTEKPNLGDVASYTTDRKIPDVDYDQRLMPRSGVFIELYNPWAPYPLSGDLVGPPQYSAQPFTPPEFYVDSSNKWQNGVVLNKVNSAGSPVWRIGFQMQPNVQIDPISGSLKFDRTIYFVPTAATVTNIQNNIDSTNNGEIFYSSLPIAPVLPNRYAVIGSAGQSVDNTGMPLDLNNNGINDYVTTVGRQATATERDTAALMYDQTRRIVLEPTADETTSLAFVYNNGGGEPALSDIQRPIGIVIDQPRSLSLTDPFGGYRTTVPGGAGNIKVPWITTSALNPSISPNTNGVYWMPGNAANEGAFSQPIDTPLDATSVNAPVLYGAAGQQNYCWVYLQRLANPLLAWDAQTNPYRTIDAAPCDVDVFNGLGAEASGTVSTPPPVSIQFQARQRGDWDKIKTASMLWRQDFNVNSANRPTSSPSLKDEENFDRVLLHSLGYLNTNYQPMFTSTTSPQTANNQPYNGAPQSIAFPWLNWNNRPFANCYELLQVPCFGSSQLLQNYSTPAYLSAQSSSQKNYNYTTMTDSTLAGPNTEYSHLLNMMYSESLSANGPPVTTIANICRIFDFIQTPSPYAGTEKWYNPTVFATAGTAGTAGQFYRPPYNSLTRFREPGRININTVFIDPTSGSSPVLDAVFKGFPSMDSTTFFTKVRQSRQGYNDPVVNNMYPTEFANPFRSANSADLMPLPVMRQTNSVNATLLRPDPTNANVPLFDYPASGNQYDDSSRNSYFRYQGLQRLGNLLTTHSNVFAVWITVGYFEAETSASGADAAHPDGYQIDQEIGIDSNTVERHRAFYIIDRSIPVAFEPGQDHNVDRAVLVRRFIE